MLKLLRNVVAARNPEKVVAGAARSAMSPPVPAQLCLRLKAYPAYIERLQQALNAAVLTPDTATPRFELAVWALEGRLARFLSETRRELDVARTSSNPERLAKAQAKERMVASARLKHVWIADAAMVSYFQAGTESQR